MEIFNTFRTMMILVMNIHISILLMLTEVAHGTTIMLLYLMDKRSKIDDSMLRKTCLLGRWGRYSSQEEKAFVWGPTKEHVFERRGDFCFLQ